MSDLTLCLWFDGRAEEAANFYVDAFKACGRSAAVGPLVRYGDFGGPGTPGAVMTAPFTLGDQDLLGLNGGPNFSFTPALSLTVSCQTQEELDQFWARLSDGGQPGVCGWLIDRFGVSWQIVPASLPGLLQGGSQAQVDRMMAAVMTMTKLDIAAMERAHAEI